MSMDNNTQACNQKSLTTRHKCSACFKQFKRKEHLVEHMEISYHSIHQPRCGVCHKHCKSYQSLREHLIGSLAKPKCSTIFSDQGCDICMKVFDNHKSLGEHRETCCLSAHAPLGETLKLIDDSKVTIARLADRKNSDKGPEVVALDCEMVGGGFDGAINICARVCLIDEDENVLFHAYCKYQKSRMIPKATMMLFELTGLSEEHFKGAIRIKEVHDKIQEILYHGESISRIRFGGGRARLLVGHSLEHDLYCLRMNYLDHMQRDMAKYGPLMVRHSFKYLTKTYLGYDIQSGVHDPYGDCICGETVQENVLTRPQGRRKQNAKH